MKLSIASLVFLVSAPIAAQCTIGAPGTADPAPPVDNWSNILPLGFAFPFNGVTYTDFYYSDHGLVALSNGGTPAVPPGGAQVYTPGSAGFTGFGADVICAYWGDNTVGTAGAVHIDNTSGTHCTITWLDNEPYLSFTAGAFTAQVTLWSDGTVVICQDGRCNNTSSTFGSLTTTVGVYSDGATIPAPSDLSAGVTTTDAVVFEDFVGPGPGGTNTPDPNYDLGDTTIMFTPTGTGWTVTTSPLACAATTTVGTGCGGMSLTSDTLPTLGGSWDLTIAGGGVVDFVVFGDETPAIALDVLAPGAFAAGCNAYLNNTLGFLNAGAPTSVAIPLNAALKGAQLTAQGLGAQTGFWIVSNAETATVGW